jgi:hypothetical protein
LGACSTNIYLSDGSKASQQGTAANGSGSGAESGSGSGESSIALVPSNDGQSPSESPQRATGGQRTYTDGQSEMRAPSGRLPDGADAAQHSANDWEESPLLSKRHYPIPNYADPSSDAGVLPNTPRDLNSSPGYFAATTIPAPSGLIVMLGAFVRGARRRLQ